MKAHNTQFTYNDNDMLYTNEAWAEIHLARLERNFKKHIKQKQAARANKFKQKLSGFILTSLGIAMVVSGLDIIIPGICTTIGGLYLFLTQEQIMEF